MSKSLNTNENNELYDILTENTNLQINRRLCTAYVLTNLKDQSNEAFEYNSKDLRESLEYVNAALRFGMVPKNSNANASIYDVWDGLIKSTEKTIRLMKTLMLSLPGFQDDTVNMRDILEHRIYDYFLLKYSKLFINGESYYFLSNGIVYDRKLMNEVGGDELSSKMLNFITELNGIDLTQTEIALLIPFILTISNDGRVTTNTGYLQNLNEWYKKAFLLEISTSNQRAVRLNSLLKQLPMLNYLYDKNVRTLKPILK